MSRGGVRRLRRRKNFSKDFHGFYRTVVSIKSTRRGSWLGRVSRKATRTVEKAKKKDRGCQWEGKREKRRRRSREERDRPPPLVDTDEPACERSGKRQRRGSPSSASASFPAPAASLSSRRRASWEAGRDSISDTLDRSLCRRAPVSSPSPYSRRSRPEIISTVLHWFASLFYSFPVTRRLDLLTWKSFLFSGTPRPIVRRNGIHFWPFDYRPPLQLRYRSLTIGTLISKSISILPRPWRVREIECEEKEGPLRNHAQYRFSVAWRVLRGWFPPRKLFNVIYERISLEQRSHVSRWFRNEYLLQELVSTNHEIRWHAEADSRETGRRKTNYPCTGEILSLLGVSRQIRITMDGLPVSSEWYAFPSSTSSCRELAGCWRCRTSQ